MGHVAPKPSPHTALLQSTVNGGLALVHMKGAIRNKDKMVFIVVISFQHMESPLCFTPVKFYLRLAGSAINNIYFIIFNKTYIFTALSIKPDLERTDKYVKIISIYL